MADIAIDDLLAPGHLTEFTIGAFLGIDWDPAGCDIANKQALKFFQHLKLIPSTASSVLCPFRLIGANGIPLVDNNGDPVLCGRLMTVKRAEKRKLGFRFRCRGAGQHRHVEKMISPLQNTLIEHTKYEMRQLMKLCYLFLIEAPLTRVIGICGSNMAAVRWYFWIREALTTAAWHDYDPIGGAGDIVEIDETHLFTRKYHVGRVLAAAQTWLFGGLSRVTGKRFGVIVRLRDRATLLPEMLENIDRNSFICSDGWAAYNTCDLHFRGHGVVIHSTNFVEPPKGRDPKWLAGYGFHQRCIDQTFHGPCPLPPDPVLGAHQPVRYHIQRCERQWLDLKKKVRGVTRKTHMGAYIGEWMYRHNLLKEEGDDLGAKMRRMLNDISRVYPGPGENSIKANKNLCKCDDCAN